MGKSTSAQILAREKGFVYYEADTFRRMVNPFIALDLDNPSMAITKQKKLNGKTLKAVLKNILENIYVLDSGRGAKERSEVIREVNSEWASMMQGLDFNIKAVKSFYRELAMDIKTQKQRIGGDWAVAHVVFRREIRDMMRLVFLDDLTKHIFFQRYPWYSASVHQFDNE